MIDRAESSPAFPYPCFKAVGWEVKVSKQLGADSSASGAQGLLLLVAVQLYAAQPTDALDQLVQSILSL